jgi:hypothetical protein
MERALLIVGLGLLPAATVLAGPTVVRDTRVTDLGTTPVLGRGYSLATNTFQSACLKDVVITEPSYDFQYLFKDVETSSSSSVETSVTASGSYSNWWVSAEASASASSASKRGRTAHSIVVTLNMDTYYASVNEAGTPLSESAAALLDREDVPGFFAACGPYYVRGINRNAQFVSLFTYESQTSQRDDAFEAKLKADLKGFGASGGFSVESKTKLSSEASSKSLVITTRGWGLGKNEDASLISYDIDTFKAAIKQAFISMQNPLTGRVTSIEVVPWVENTAFQTKLNLANTDVVSGKVVPLYEKKDILTMNGEFLSELERASRARLNAYYTARMCKSTLLAKYSDDGKSVIQVAAKKPLKNHRTGRTDPTPVTLDALLKQVEDAQQGKLWEEYSKFTYSGNPSMRGCIAKLMADPSSPPPAAAAGGAALGAGGAANPAGPQSGAASEGVGRGIFLKRFLDHSECVSMQALFVPPKVTFEDFCMPELQGEL